MDKLSLYFSVMVLAVLRPNWKIVKKIRLACQRRISRYFRQ